MSNFIGLQGSTRSPRTCHLFWWYQHDGSRDFLIHLPNLPAQLGHWDKAAAVTSLLIQGNAIMEDNAVGFSSLAGRRVETSGDIVQGQGESLQQQLLHDSCVESHLFSHVVDSLGWYPKGCKPFPKLRRLWIEYRPRLQLFFSKSPPKKLRLPTREPVMSWTSLVSTVRVT